MKSKIIYLAFLFIIINLQHAHSLSRPEMEFKIFQFPRDSMPRIDGNAGDWDIVPPDYIYGSDLINDTEDGNGPADPKDLDIRVTVGWVKGLNRLYFLYEAYDDFWDFGRFNPKGYSNDIFEIAVDGDLSGGSFIHNEQIKDRIQYQTTFSGVHAQNYHIYTPPVNGDWCLVWGCQPWIKDFPHSNQAYSYDFKHGEEGRLVLEFWIAPYDYAPYEGPEHAVVSKLTENNIIGLSWSILDFDGGKRDGHYNLAHNVKMVHNASFLCAFRLMPLEEKFRKPVEAHWSFSVVDRDRRTFAFIDASYGDITGWKWDFGDGTTSNEQNPVHTYPKPTSVYSDPSVYYVVTLEVEGPAGTSKRSRFWDIQVK